MELKVWVDGIQRVVSGATFDTTCQDVVIALAHAMDRTGRFTLIEKWRQNDRPLTPAECPLKVLHKWGEYAAEVRFILCQADLDGQKQSTQFVKKGADRPVFSHNFTPPSLHGAAANVKRSLTFSGAHSHIPDPFLWQTNKFRKTSHGPVPNGDVSDISKSGHASHPSVEPGPKQQKSHVGGQQAKTLLTQQHLQHPVPPPRRRCSPALVQQPKDSVNSNAKPSDHQSVRSNTDRPSPVPLPHSPRLHPVVPQPISHSEMPPAQHLAQQRAPIPSPRPHPMSCARSLSPMQGETRTADLSFRSQTPSPEPPPLPSSPPPIQGNIFPVAEASEDPSDQCRRPSLEIEEYDLEHNFPDTARDMVCNDRPSISLEYRLEDGIGPGSGNQLEGNHAKLMRLVNMQQEHLKVQESKISLINTEITALEEKEKEYEEKLHFIMEELLVHENRQQEFEPQLSELEAVEWENVLDSEKKCEADLTVKIAALKASVVEHEQKLEDVRSKEHELLNELREAEEKMRQEKERLQAEEDRAKEEERKMKEELSKLQAEFSEEQEKAAECEVSVSSAEDDLKAVEKDFMEKQTMLTDLESKLKDENLKEFAGQEIPKSPHLDSGEAIIKILEGRLSPRPLAGSNQTAENPPTHPVMAVLSAKNQSGVWV